MSRKLIKAIQNQLYEQSLSTQFYRPAWSKKRQVLPEALEVNNSFQKSNIRIRTKIDERSK